MKYTKFTDDDLLLVLSNTDSTNRAIKEIVDVITECTRRYRIVIILVCMCMQ